MKLTNFTYRKPREKKPEPQAPGVYRATIYNVSEWTNNEGETVLFVNVEIGSEYGFGIKFRLNADKDNTKEYAQYFFSSLLDACGIDGETFDGETDVLIGKSVMLTLEAGQYGLNAKKFEPVEAEPEPQGNNQYVDAGQVEDWDYNNPPSYMNESRNNSNSDTPF